MFKNLVPFKLAEPISEEALNEATAKRTFVAPGPNDVQTAGFVPPFPDCDLVYPAAGHLIIALRIDTKSVPAAVIKEEAAKRVKAIEESEGRKVGRKELREIKEMIGANLLPRAFPKTKICRVIFDTQKSRILIESGSQSQACDVLSTVREAVGTLQTNLYPTENPLRATLTNILDNGFFSDCFDTGASADLEGSNDESSVKIRNQELLSDEVKTHIASGSVCTALEIEWADKVVLTVTESLELKRIKPLKLLDEALDKETEGCDDIKAARDAMLFLELSEMRLLITDLFEELGVEE